MTALAAITVGSELLLTDFDAVVTGVFDRACNFRLVNGRLATCTTADYFDIPRGIRVDTPADFRFQSAVGRGTSIHCRGGIVRFSASSLKIDCRGAVVWRGKFKPRSRPPAGFFVHHGKTPYAYRSRADQSPPVLFAGPPR